MITVLIIEHHNAVRQALSLRLKAVPHLHVVGAIPSINEAQQIMAGICPDIIIYGVGHETTFTTTTLEMLDCFVQKRTAVIVLTPYINEEERQHLISLGIDNYLLKNIDSNALVAAIDQVDLPISL
ncbi:MAG TPA: response regulator [Anaerolineae bacterium]|nr:response regulator [Anaerolineae bacterium]